MICKSCYVPGLKKRLESVNDTIPLTICIAECFPPASPPAFAAACRVVSVHRLANPANVDAYNMRFNQLCAGGDSSLAGSYLVSDDSCLSVTLRVSAMMEGFLDIAIMQT